MKSSRVFRCAACLLAALLALIQAMPIAQAADGINAAYYKLVEVQTGTVAGEIKVNVRKKPDADSDRLGRLAPGESCVITGEEGDWWRIEFEEETGYVLKELLTVTTSMEEVPVIVEDPLEASLTGLTPPTLLQYRNEYEISGVITSNIPMTKVTVDIYNKRTFTVDRTASDEMDREENVREYDLAQIADDISFRKVEPGEKKLMITVESANDSAIVSETSFYIYTDGDMYADPVNMTGGCDIKVSRGDEDDLTDYDYKTSLKLSEADDAIEISLPAGKTAGAVAVHWQTAPESFVVEQMGEGDAVIDVLTQENPDGMIHFYLDLDPKTQKIRISTADEGKAVCELRVYELNKTPEMVEQWQALPEKLDLLVVSTHQDDEMLFFGGTIPYYAAQGKKVGVVYMANCSRLRYAEAMDGLWSCGLKYHPIFVGFVDKRPDDYQEAVDLWGMDNTVNALVDIIRKYQPEVIVTHDVNGEYGHNQHILTCAAMRDAVTKSGDAAISPESAQNYGTWTPKKLYIHLYNENSLTMTVYDEPVEALDGMTMTQVATIGYSKHVSQQDYFTMENHGVRYDNRKYGLAFTTVGQDVEKNDLFENID